MYGRKVYLIPIEVESFFPKNFASIVIIFKTCLNKPHDFGNKMSIFLGTMQGNGWDGDEL